MKPAAMFRIRPAVNSSAGKNVSMARETGLFLIGYAVLAGWLGTRQAMPKPLVVIVIAGNAARTLASIALLFSGVVTPNPLGEAFVSAQAIVAGAICRTAAKRRRSGGLKEA